MPAPTVQEVSEKLEKLRVELAPFVQSANALTVVPKGKAPAASAASPQDPRSLFDLRIAAAPTQELAELMKTKAEWDKLTNEAARKKIDNDLKRFRAIAKIGMPILALGTGVLLTFTGFGWIGAIAVGAGLGLAPTIIEKIIDRFPGGGA